ncbi:MAG: DNA methyltransferase [Candidatus Tyrphobacter sp.]
MNPTEIEFAVRDLVVKQYDPASFPFDLIGIYNAPKSTVTKLRSGQTNAATSLADVLWKKWIFFRSIPTGHDVGAEADALAADPLTVKHKPRFIFVTDGEQVHVRDLKLDDTCNAEFDRLDEQADFLLPLAGFERRGIVEEHPADIRAAKKLKKLYDAILAANPTWASSSHAHELNVFMTRILFCLYAENTGIFDTPKIFRDTIEGQTTEDGGLVAPLLDRLFRVMNTEEAKRPADTPSTEKRFPYVNGSLFENTLEVPQFNRTSRRLLLECADLDWTSINPDIFGSMIQTIAVDGTRSVLGMHYTSVPNIMRALEPLFLAELTEAFEKAKDSVAKLEALLARLSRLRVFDPACGSGNFLVIAYKELRKLEIAILERIAQISPQSPLRLSDVSLKHFFGIDVVDFACETAKLSLWIAEHQMNSAFKDIFGSARPTLPLPKITTIHSRNALNVDWLEICPPMEAGETFICGNPPYQGLNNQSSDQRADIVSIVAPILSGDTKVDYVACWLVKLCDYIIRVDGSTGALVATNSICQGEQVAFLWPYVFGHGLCISFAHASFKWSNSASHNAGVTCIIVGIARSKPGLRRLYGDSYHVDVPNINGYLIPSDRNVAVTKRKIPISDLPLLDQGSQAIDGGHLFVTPSERQAIVEAYPAASSLFRRFYGAQEMLYSEERYAIWIDEDQRAFAGGIPPIADRIRRTAEYRMTGGQHAKRYADSPHRFAFVKHREQEALAIPQISSEERPYLQIGRLGPSDVAGHALYVVYGPPAYLFALLSSRMHRIWTQAVAGKLETRIRYSEGLIYNTFPVPELSNDQKRSLGDRSKAIIVARARHPGKTMAWLYNTMPENLLAAHQDNDQYVEEIVYGRRFRDDTQRLEHLFKMYENLAAHEDTPLLTENNSDKKVRS